MGNYTPIKEIAALAGGDMGIKIIAQCVSSVLLSATNVFVGNTIGIEPMNLYYIYLIAVVISFPLTMVRAYIVDNTRNKKGKCRPYVISMGIPTVLLSIGYFWMPYEKMESQVTKCVVHIKFMDALCEVTKARHEQAIEDARLESERVEAEKKAHAEMLRTKKANKK